MPARDDRNHPGRDCEGERMMLAPDDGLPFGLVILAVALAVIGLAAFLSVFGGHDDAR